MTDFLKSRLQKERRARQNEPVDWEAARRQITRGRLTPIELEALVLQAQHTICGPQRLPLGELGPVLRFLAEIRVQRTHRRPNPRTKPTCS